MYDSENVFAKIIREEIPADKIYEDEQVLAFNDINPVAPIHVLVVPKGQYKDYSDFIQKASNEEISHYFKIIGQIISQIGAEDYRLVTNKGSSAGQTIYHFHTHIISGRQMKEL